ncbi:MAG: tRNA pseudouridine(13) synthase TruD [Candidatus Thermoplasmatota archaeon]|nr:tRNA pseudouridine(13) synthase TruD [Candidatus Thermoplasmatota archaeon]
MLPSFDYEKSFGIEWFITNSPGTGGKLKVLPEDFVVEEQGEPKPGEGFTGLKIRYRNWESHSLRMRLQRDLGLREADISVAGTKDKRAVVSQWITLRRRTPPKNLDIPDFEILQSRPCGSMLRTGDHQGNSFTIRVKNMDVDEEEALRRAKDAMGEMKEHWPNFFGIQRFGVYRPVTHIVGRELVKNGPEEAVMVYLGKSRYSEGQEQEARKMVEQGAPWGDVLWAMPQHCNFERMMLDHLSRHEDDFAGALARLPTSLVLLFVHSYQSYLFNRILSKRLEAGLPLDQPVVGDMIEPATARIKGGRPRFIPVTSQNLNIVTSSVKDGKGWITAALPGTDSTLAEGEPGEMERKVLEEEGLETNWFSLRGMPDMSSKGTRRHVAMHPQGMQIGVDGGLLASFTLSSGSYATTIMREIMKNPDPLAY